ncbi:MAG: response regulator [Methanoregula sp.]|jgi:PAS domain S-box-containing protein
MITILYVDDDPALLELGKVYIEWLGNYRVIIVQSAREALGLFRQSPADAIVSDYQMPEMNGVEFLKELRRFDSRVPFILFTAKCEEELTQELQTSHNVFYLQKGTNLRSVFTELTTMIRWSVDHRQTIDRLSEYRAAYSLLLERSREAVVLMKDSTFLHCNRRALDLFGFSQEQQMVGHTTLEFSPDIQHGGIASEEKIRELMVDPSQAMPGKVTWDYLRKDGSVFTTEVNLVPVPSTKNSLVQISIHKIDPVDIPDE